MMKGSQQQISPRPCPYLMSLTMALTLLGLILVASASISMAARDYGEPYHFFVRQLVFALMGGGLFVALLRVPSHFWYQISRVGLLMGLCLLILVLIPGMGVKVNGASRWLALPGLRLQVSELVKLMMVFYMAGYIVRHREEISTQVSGFIKPLVLLALVTALLLAEPDFGASVVIFSTMMMMLFLAGVPWRYFLTMLLLGSGIVAGLIWGSPYRWARLTSFLDPWASPYDGGYQLTQALIAFGRGGWWGVGLGHGIQKLFYLPEAHTDFIFAVLAEELGLLGAMVVLGLYVALLGRLFWWSYQAWLQESPYMTFVFFGIGIWLSLQVVINIGVTAGLFPTKGLTLPFVSYGGSSLLVNLSAMAIACRFSGELMITTPRGAKRRTR